MQQLIYKHGNILPEIYESEQHLLDLRKIQLHAL